MLARLTLPNGQVLPAGAFLPAVEDGPIGRAIDRLALAEALRALAADPGLRLSVNMSPRSMGDEEWLGDPGAAAPAARRLRAADPGDHRGRGDAGRAARPPTSWTTCARTGCAFALDDFGAGATGFRHFRDFRFDMVKIDGAFVQGVARRATRRCWSSA